MDLGLHLRVLARHKAVLVVGLSVAVSLALMSFVNIGSGGVSYRHKEKWQSVTRLFAAQSGYPFKPGLTGSSGVDPTTFAVLTAEFANSDAVRQILRKRGEIDGQILAAPAKTDGGDPLPFIDVAGIAATPREARSLARRAAAALAAYAQARQAQNGVTPERQIVLQVVSRPDQPVLLEGRPKGTPMLIFLALASLTLGGIYVIENLRGQRRGQHVAADSGEMPSVERNPVPREARHDATDTPLALPDRGARRDPDAGARRPTTTLRLDHDRSAWASDELPRAEEG